MEIAAVSEASIGFTLMALDQQRVEKKTLGA